MPIPIVFVHRGGLPFIGDRFLRIALRQAQLASPLNQIFLMTDYRRPWLPGINQVRLGDLGNPAGTFQKSYRHASSNYRRYERFCFSRWFYVREFMKQRGIERACVLDSDIMLFSPIECFVSEFSGYEAGNWSWANVVTAKGVNLICEHFGRISNDRAAHALILEKYGVVSDMTVLIGLAQIDGSVMDQSPLASKGFDGNFNFSQGKGQFHFLHFQGPAKRFMRGFAWDRGTRAIELRTQATLPRRRDACAPKMRSGADSLCRPYETATLSNLPTSSPQPSNPGRLSRENRSHRSMSAVFSSTIR